MHRRLALVVGLALLLGALAFTFAPSKASDATCGWWFNTEWDRAESKKIADEYWDMLEESQADALSSPGIAEVEGEIRASALDIAQNYRACTDELTRRRNISIGLLAGAVMVPVAILFVAGRENQTAS